eukprot:12897254-Prorocentrum_lima.AAC.1
MHTLKPKDHVAANTAESCFLRRHCLGRVFSPRLSEHQSSLPSARCCEQHGEDNDKAASYDVQIMTEANQPPL